MGRKRIPGLIKRGEIWHIDKRVCGRRVCQSTGTAQLEEAERFLVRLIEETRQAQIYGVRPTRTFEQAAAKFVIEKQHKSSLRDDISRLKGLMPWIGEVPLDRLHMGILQPWIDHRREQEIAVGTINHGLQLVRCILNLAAGEWVDEHGLTWLHAAPKIKMLPNVNKRQPYPIDWDEQSALMRELPPHLADMALFALNTGCRDAEICNLRWDWEVLVPELQTTVFVIPGAFVKNREERLIVLNSLAKSVIEGQRGRHRSHAFIFDCSPIRRMNNSAWRRARSAAGLESLRVHDLKHTFGRRLRAAGVSFEDRQDLLGHCSSRVTTHYSAAELAHLIEAANLVCERNGRRPELVVLRGNLQPAPAKLPRRVQKNKRRAG